MFIPKYRCKVLYGENRKRPMGLMKGLLDNMGIEMVEGPMCIDHVHLSLWIPPKYSATRTMGYLRGEELPSAAAGGRLQGTAVLTAAEQSPYRGPESTSSTGGVFSFLSIWKNKYLKHKYTIKYTISVCDLLGWRKVMTHKFNLKIENEYVYFLALLPILDQYKLCGITFEILFGGFSLLLIVLKRGVLVDNNRLRNSVLILILYTFLITMVQGLRLQADSFRIMFRIGLYILLTLGVCFLVTDVSSYKEFKNIYERIVVVLSLITIAQFLLYTFTGRATMLLVPGLDLNYSPYNSSEYSAEVLSRLSYGWYYRPCSLFLEPAHHAQYVMPWLFIELLSANTSEKMRLRKCVLVSIGLLLTASSLGVLGCVIAWVMAFVRWSSKLNERTLIKNTFFLFAMVVMLFVLLRIPSVRFYFEMKVAEITASNWDSNSFTVRMIRGFACFAKFDFLDKFLGCGYGNILQYLTVKNISTVYDGRMEDLSYMNGAATLLCGYGILGSVYYIHVFFIKNYVRSAAYFGLLWCIVFVMLTSAVFNSPVYYIALSLILLMQVDSKTHKTEMML